MKSGTQNWPSLGPPLGPRWNAYTECPSVRQTAYTYDRPLDLGGAVGGAGPTCSGPNWFCRFSELSSNWWHTWPASPTREVEWAPLKAQELPLGVNAWGGQGVYSESEPGPLLLHI